MIFQETTNYKFQTPIFKIHYFSPAFDSSVVLVAQKGIGADFLLHITKQNEIAFKHDFQDFVDSLAMPNEREAVVLRVEEDLIYIFDLMNKTTRKVVHYFFSQVSCQNEVNYFCDTKLLCIHENGDNQNLRMTLTYYEWPLVSDTPTPLVFFDANGEDWNPSFLVKKIDSHSKYAWTQSRHSGVFQVRIHQIINNKTFYKVHSISMKSLSDPYPVLDKMQAAIVQMWEYRPNVLLLFTATNKNEKKAINPETNVVNNNFIWDLTKQTIRESNFVFAEKYQDLLVDMVGTPSLSMFRTFYFEPGRAVQSPAYFIQNETESIIKTERWTCSHLQKYMVLEKNRDTIVEGIFENMNVSELRIRVISLVIRRELSMFLLKNMKDQPKEEWDCDLFVDIFKMLDYEEAC